jgi:hypothetical protein
VTIPIRGHLSTGTNSCLFDGNNIANIDSLGYLMEMKAADIISEKLLGDYIRGYMPVQ